MKSRVDALTAATSSGGRKSAMDFFRFHASLFTVRSLRFSESVFEGSSDASELLETDLHVYGIVWLRLDETPGLASGVPVTTAGTEPCAKQANGDEAPPSGHQKLA